MFIQLYLLRTDSNTGNRESTVAQTGLLSNAFQEAIDIGSCIVPENNTSNTICQTNQTTFIVEI